MATYPNADLLVETDWLAAHLDDPGLRLVDMGVRLGEEPRTQRIPGAASPPHPYLKGSENARFVAGPDEAKALIEALGIGDGAGVIAYDSARSLNAARLWWVLRYYGHGDVRVLNGGFDKWAAEGRVVEEAAGNAAAPATFTPRPDPDVLSTVDTLRSAVGDAASVIWDTRSIGEYTGEVDRGNARAGHVPGARHLEWSDLMAADATFRPAGEIRAALEELGITPDKRVHTY